MGHKGAGKSTSGNTILGREKFDKKRSAQCVRRHGEVVDGPITAIEAPGWWKNYTVEESPELLKQEMLLSVSLCPPGPHVVLLIIPLFSKFKEKEIKALQGHLDLLGERVWSHTIVRFTYGDYLLGTPIEQHIESEGHLQWLVDKCGNRYHVLNNLNRSDETQIKELLEKIEETVAENHGCHFEIERTIIQEVEERKRAQEERAKERMKMMQKRRENIRLQMMRGVEKSDTRSVGSSAYSSFGSGTDSRSDSPFSFVDGLYIRKGCNRMELPSPFMSGDERSDTMSVRSPAYSSNTSEAEDSSS
ncbi:GTPase IMAP family member 4-like [Pseudorasbora parva]|uniref:GTPase IMAP family member 4-like n=1 Tax=Pseudorasbora parva TaxID=51549 RepID=UPI00351E3B03